MIDFLFVYGTLLQPGNPFAHYLSQYCTYISSGKLKGLLYDIGEYPGAILTDNTDHYIYGSIFKLHHPEENLRVIDDYEGYGPEQSQPNLYIRSVASIETHNGFINAWIYLYNLPTYRLPQIKSGNYAEYIKQKKSPGS
ncbi:gamma-glutamylcyclotransferase [Mucilaginibacter rigui]|uniref:Gamma-glutamylcyclotransferase n=1 Tax=Mucilaginibacter rigui TaxID=534635 RepID=A0ABR7XA80_9SPHI|nr:gamma-glutamylcyclotransferase family protein [Mucilaginibacter rigui]MBD1387446.1 gamma-glutamylcyclotransferase [Mucilaginibacter rigui]